METDGKEAEKRQWVKRRKSSEIYSKTAKIIKEKQKREDNEERIGERK